MTPAARPTSVPTTATAAAIASCCTQAGRFLDGDSRSVGSRSALRAGGSGLGALDTSLWTRGRCAEADLSFPGSGSGLRVLDTVHRAPSADQGATVPVPAVDVVPDAVTGLQPVVPRPGVQEIGAAASAYPVIAVPAVDLIAPSVAAHLVLVAVSIERLVRRRARP